MSKRFAVFNNYERQILDEALYDWIDEMSARENTTDPRKAEIAVAMRLRDELSTIGT